MLGRPTKVRIKRGDIQDDYWMVEGPDPLTGKRRRRFFHRLDEAKRAQTEINGRAPAQEPLHPLCDPEVQVGPYATRWLELGKHGWKPRTYRSFADTLHLHVLPFAIGPAGRVLGDVRVREWHRGIVPALLAAKREAGYAPDSVRIMFATVSGLLTKAVADRLLAYHPVDAAVRKDLRPLLKPAKPEMRAFDTDQARRFLATAHEHSELYPLYATGFLAGARLGELTGLQLEDDRGLLINGRRVRQLRIERSLGQECSVRDPKPGAPKNGEAREVNVGADLGAIFDTIKAERKGRAVRQAWRPLPPWMFVTRNGTPYSQRNVLRDFARVLRLAGLAARGFTPHSMRHTFASLHILAGKSAKWLQQQMGHSSIKVTLDTYACWFALQDHAAADELGEALLGNAAGNKR